MKRTMFVVLLAAVALFAMVGTAHAANNASQAATITASINKKIVLTITNGAVNFGTLDPGDSVSTTTVGINVQSNADFTATRVRDATAISMGLTVPSNTTVFDGSTQTKQTAGHTYTEEYDLTVPWALDPNLSPYTGHVTYTVMD